MKTLIVIAALAAASITAACTPPQQIECPPGTYRVLDACLIDPVTVVP